MITDELYIQHYCRINSRQQILLNHQWLENKEGCSSEDWYRRLNLNYVKFFKMDQLCKWSWLAAELISVQFSPPLSPETGIVLHTHNGCIDVDRQFLKSTETIASPALFVYTLPNIMMGEIAIRHSFKGPQLLLVKKNFDAADLVGDVKNILGTHETSSAICGWVNVLQHQPEVVLFGVTTTHNNLVFNEHNCRNIWNNAG